jgi:hypothetical protein
MHISGNMVTSTVSVKGGVGADMATSTVSDDNAGFVPKVDNKRRGLGLMNRLVRQFHGIITASFTYGAVWMIRVHGSQPETAAFGILGLPKLSIFCNGLMRIRSIEVSVVGYAINTSYFCHKK